jgi:polar amino acid transport system substrate-binding protein
MTLALGLLAGTAVASTPVRPHLRVAVLNDSPPFSYQNTDGTWSGLAVDLWRLIADQLEVDYELIGLDREPLFDSVSHGEANVGVGPITLTATRFARMQFSVPYYVTGLSFVVPRERSAATTLVDNLLSPMFVKLFSSLLCLLVVVGVLFWILERRGNPAEFGGRHLHGIGSGLWLAVVTMTTVGYGDKSPKTLGGRIMAVAWMFVSIVLISTFTGTVASVLTADRMAPSVRTPEDLVRVRVVAVANSAAEGLLHDEHIATRSVASVDAALQELVAGRADVVAHDRALLTYRLKQEPNLPVTLLPGTFFMELYGLTMPLNTPYLRRIDEIILTIVESAQWRRLQFDYLGSRDGS